MTHRTAALAALAALALPACAGHAGGDAPAGPDTPSTYHVYVAAESADLLHRVRFTPGGGAEVEKTTAVGRYPTETEGPHGLGIAPDGRHLYLTTGHGVPSGMIWKYALGPDTLVAPELPLGFFPATLDVTPDGLFAFVVNFNLHGEHVPSSVSVVYTPDMLEVQRTETCMMPHGSRVNPQGTRHYSACMMEDQLVEVDTRDFQVARRFRFERDGESACSPTWAEPGADGGRVYVACNRSDRIHELDVASWTVSRTFPTGRGPYNLEVTPDGRLLIATLKAEGAVQVFDLATGRSLATSPSTTTLTHGVVSSPDSRYAFVSVEGVGAEPGKLDIYDLRSFELLESVELGQQAGGIAFWRMTP